MGIQRELVKQFFPQDREGFNRRYPRGDGIGMSRQEHVDRAVVLINNTLIGRCTYARLYPDGESWDDLIGRLKPWLKTDDTFAEWGKLDAFDRFNYLTSSAK